jgi:hypothetical protein
MGGEKDHDQSTSQIWRRGLNVQDAAAHLCLDGNNCPVLSPATDISGLIRVPETDSDIPALTSLI